MTESVIVSMPTSLAEEGRATQLCGAAEVGTLRVLSEAAPQCHFANAPLGASTSALHQGSAISKTTIAKQSRRRARGNTTNCKAKSD